MGSFNPNIPLPGDFLSVSQKQILSNYQTIANAFLENHVPLTAVENLGMHEVLTLRPQNTDPTTASNQSAIYNKLDSNNSPQLFFRPDSNQTPIQMSNSNLSTLQTGATVDAQSSFIAGPFTIYFGFFADCPLGQIITLLPASTLIYVGLSTILPAGIPVGLATTTSAFGITGNQFQVTYNNTATGITTPKLPTIYYMAIGK